MLTPPRSWYYEILVCILDVLYEEHLHGKDLSKMKDLEHVNMTGVGEYLPAVKRILGGLLGKIPRMKQWPDGKQPARQRFAWPDRHVRKSLDGEGGGVHS
jgi:hypothetical protein